ncbi:PREDICTED: RILP-like protein 2, partial [Chlamydotis macqueenii]|uniref:RILP-like protein 2 n=1 Tax=Chlamydotis macqueenii TaxID=187382 RepID=UPI0005297908
RPRRRFQSRDLQGCCEAQRCASLAAVSPQRLTTRSAQRRAVRAELRHARAELPRAQIRRCTALTFAAIANCACTGPLSLGPDKMVIDLTDPNRPRFTLQELRDVLQERNQLKAQLLVVQEELQCYKSGIISQRRDQTEELEKEASGSNPSTSKDSKEKTIIKRLFSFKHGK